jgi:hypothetical protein
MDRDARSLADLGTPGDRVHLVVPPSSEFLRTVRLVAADAAGRAGCTFDEVEDFRIAIDELTHLLMTATDHFVHLTVTTLDSRVVARGTAKIRAATTKYRLDGVSELIVRATVDQHEVRQRRDEITFEAVKLVGDDHRVAAARELARRR